MYLERNNITYKKLDNETEVMCLCAKIPNTNMLKSINQSINQSWIYIAHTRKASNALLRSNVLFTYLRAQNLHRHIGYWPADAIYLKIS